MHKSHNIVPVPCPRTLDRQNRYSDLHRCDVRILHIRRTDHHLLHPRLPRVASNRHSIVCPHLSIKFLYVISIVPIKLVAHPTYSTYSVVCPRIRTRLLLQKNIKGFYECSVNNIKYENWSCLIPNYGHHLTKTYPNRPKIRRHFANYVIIKIKTTPASKGKYFFV